MKSGGTEEGGREVVSYYEYLLEVVDSVGHINIGDNR